MLQKDTAGFGKGKNKRARGILAVVGLGCILQFFVVAGIGVVRGYSVQSSVSDVVLVAGLLLILPCFSRERRSAVCICFISFWIIYTSGVGMLQGGDIQRGQDYYAKGEYEQALQAFKKEAGVWYHLLRYNSHEGTAMLMVGKTYCQLEDFDNACRVYELIIDRYAVFDAQQAKGRLKALEKGLAMLGKNAGQIPEGDDRLWGLYDIARTYQYDLNCHAKALEVYRQIIDLDITEDRKVLAREQITELTILADK